MEYSSNNPTRTRSREYSRSYFLRDFSSLKSAPNYGIKYPIIYSIFKKHKHKIQHLPILNRGLRASRRVSLRVRPNPVATDAAHPLQSRTAPAPPLPLYSKKTCAGSEIQPRVRHAASLNLPQRTAARRFPFATIFARAESGGYLPTPDSALAKNWLHVLLEVEFQIQRRLRKCAWPSPPTSRYVTPPSCNSTLVTLL
eukprot:206192-Prorocentrum_minimum.AAC.1